MHQHSQERAGQWRHVRHTYGLHSYGLHNYGQHSYGLHGYSMCSYGLYMAYSIPKNGLDSGDMCDISVPIISTLVGIRLKGRCFESSRDGPSAGVDSDETLCCSRSRGAIDVCAHRHVCGRVRCARCRRAS